MFDVQLSSDHVFSVIRLFKTDKAQRHQYSMFDVGRSVFDVHQFLYRSDWPFFLARGTAYMRLRLAEP
jgi:hypothetical protein